MVAVGYRRAQLRRFERLLSDPAYFKSERSRLAPDSPERVWQIFFEANKWIFGYGLSYVFLSSLNDKKLEQITTGRDLGGAGKRSDAVMKTQAAISSLCFVEIKRHDTELLSNRYRPEVWAPTSELSGAVAQLQVTVQSVVERFQRSIPITDDDGDPTGENLFAIMPRSFLIAGRLDEFKGEHGVNQFKFRSFEVFRRNVRQPEILTFDELLYRAKYIVEGG